MNVSIEAPEFALAHASRAPVRLMAHLVAGFPSEENFFAAASALAQGGVSFFEIQFPFSDPSADGPAIQGACAASLAAGFTVARGFQMVRSLRERYPDIPVYIMTYGNLAYKCGIDSFVEQSAAAGVSGLIIPDLPFDSDEGLGEACARHGLLSVPVAAPSMSDARKRELLSHKAPLVYAALRSGITGSKTSIDEATLSFLASLSGNGTRVLGGFGIQDGEQSRALSPHVHAVVAGSAFVNLISANASRGSASIQDAVTAKARELCGLA